MSENYTFDETIVSDLHKDAYGYRPSSGWWAEWKSFTPDEKQKGWDRMCEVLEENEEIERRRAARSYDLWDRHISRIAAEQGISLADAIRWDMQAENAEGDVGYYCYNWGLSYSTEDEILEILKGSL